MGGISFSNIKAWFHSNEPEQPAARAQPRPLKGLAPIAPQARAAMQRAGDQSSRAKLLKLPPQAMLDKQRRNILATGKQWTQRAMQAVPSQSLEADAGLSGLGERARRLLGPHAQLREQLDGLARQGWTIEEKKLRPATDLSGHRCIAIDSNLAARDPAMFLSILARHAGAAIYDKPLSLASREQFELSFLAREAAGALNVLELSESLALSSSKQPPSLHVAASMIQAYDELRAENDGAKPSPEQMAERVRQNFQAQGQLGMRQSGQRRDPLAEEMQLQYEAFGIRGNTPAADIERAAQCLNRTGVAIAPSKLAAFATNQAGESYWLDRKSLAGSIRQSSASFTRLGIAEHQIGGLVEHALASGQYRQWGDAKRFAVTCHDPERGQAVQLFVTLGDKPGEVSAVTAGSMNWGHFARGEDGRERWFSMAQCDPALTSQSAQACASHGIDPQFLPEVIHTAMLSGKQNKLPPDPADPTVTRTEYSFTYRHQPMTAVLHTRDGSDYLTGFELKPRVQIQAQASDVEMAPDLASRMGQQGWQALAAHAAGFMLPPSTFLITVAKPENLHMASVEHPGFFQYRTQLGGQEVSLLARMENGMVVDVRSPSEFDRMLQASPTQEENLRELQRQGWQIGMGNQGEGIYCDSGRKRISLGNSMYSQGPILFDALVHEMAHARYGNNIDMRSEDSYAAYEAGNEGNSLLTEYEALEQFVSGPWRDQHLAQLSRFPSHAQAIQVYETMQQQMALASGSQERADARAAAQTAMGQIYARQNPSTDPSHVTYDMRWRTFHREHHGSQGKASRIDTLRQEQPDLTVPAAAGGFEAPSTANIAFIKALPARPDGTLGKRPGQLFITPSTLLDQSAGVDLRVFENVVNSAVTHCEPEITAVGSVAEKATFRFDLQGSGHEITMHLDNAGRVFDIKHITGPVGQGSSNPLPTAPQTE